MAHRHGFESVAPDIGYLKSISDSQLSELREDLKAKNLVWGAAGLAVNFRGDEATFQDGMKGLADDAKALQRAGASRMGTWLTPGHNSLTYLANFKQHAARLGEVGKVLGDHGVRLGLEYVGPKTSWSSMRYPFIHTMAEMRELIAAINQPGIGLVLDSWHWYTAHETEADLLRLKGSDVVCCDLNDAPAGIPIDQQKDSVRDLPCCHRRDRPQVVPQRPGQDRLRRPDPCRAFQGRTATPATRASAGSHRESDGSGLCPGELSRVDSPGIRFLSSARHSPLAGSPDPACRNGTVTMAS